MRKGDKIDKHEKALQETQLVKVKNKETLEGKVDIQKVKEIRRAIRRRYGNRSNYHKIFNQWDRHRKGFIDLTDLHYMINKLGISTNTQEARVLMASHDHAGQQRLTMEEFMDLIFSTDDNMNVDLKKLRVTNDLLEIEPNEDIMTGIQKDAARLKKIKDENLFKYMVQKCLKDVHKDFKDKDTEKTSEVDYEAFENTILSKAHLPQYIKDDKSFLQNVFKLLDTKKTGKINYQNFCEGLRTFRFMGDVDINVDLGPMKEMPESSRALNKSQEEINLDKHLHIFDSHKVPVNQLSKIVLKTLKVSRILQSKYGSKENFDKDIKEKLQSDEYGNTSAEQLENYLLNVCKDHLTKREVDRADLEGFLSSLVFNRYRTTDIRSLAPYVFSDDTQISKKIYSLQRPMPPPKELSGANQKIDTENITDSRMREILKDLEIKSFADKKRMYAVFKDYDKDGDGYISYNDVKEQFKNLKVSATEPEIRRFMDLVDSKKVGYLDFNSFASAITQNMTENLLPLPKDSEDYIYKKDRQKLVPNGDLVKEQYDTAKAFTTKFKEVRDKFLPDKNLILSIFIRITKL